MNRDLDTSSVAEDPVTDLQRRDVTLEVAERTRRLKQAVRAAGGNLAVATKSGVTLSTLNHYIAGRDMKAANLVALADACGVHIAWLAAGRGPMAVDPTPMEQVRETAKAAHEALVGPQTPQKSAIAALDQGRLKRAIIEAFDAASQLGAVPDPETLARVILIYYAALTRADELSQKS